MARITVIGNATRDFELFTTGSGGSLGKVSVAENRRWTDGAGKEREQTNYYDVLILNSEEAEHYAEWVRSGQRLIVQGDLQQSSFETQDGDKRTKWEMINAEIGASGRWALVTVEKLDRGQGGGGQSPRRSAPAAQRQAPAGRRATARASTAASSDY